jgi:hypothetical protein
MSSYQGPPERPVQERRNPRYACEGELQIRMDGTDLRSRASFRNVSLSGCLIEMTILYPVGTELELVLDLLNVRVETGAVVRTALPLLGMGVEFTSMSEANKAELEKMIDALAAAFPAA